MCRINEEMCNEARMEGFKEGFEEGFKEGFEEGKREYTIEVAQRLISMGMNTEDIAQVTKLSIEEVQSLASQP